MAQLNQQECHIWSHLKKHCVRMCVRTRAHVCVCVRVQVEKFHYSIPIYIVSNRYLCMTVTMLVWFLSNILLGVLLLSLQSKTLYDRVT